MPIGDRWSNAGGMVVSKPRVGIRPPRAKRGPSRFGRVGFGAAAAARAAPPVEFIFRAPAPRSAVGEPVAGAAGSSA